MTDTGSEPAEGEPVPAMDAHAKKAKDPDGYKNSDFKPHDWALETLLDMTVDLSVDNSIGLSVVSGGVLISGLAIHREKWRELFVAQIKGAGTEGSTDVLADALETVIGGTFVRLKEMLERRLNDDLPRPATHFLHFRDARVQSPQYSDYPLFRVSLDDVSAWSLGSHNPVEPKQD